MEIAGLDARKAMSACPGFWDIASENVTDINTDTTGPSCFVALEAHVQWRCVSVSRLQPLMLMQVGYPVQSIHFDHSSSWFA